MRRKSRLKRASACDTHTYPRAIRVKTHGPKFLELTEEEFEPTTMEEPLIIAQRKYDGERDSITREKQKLVEQRNRLESEIEVLRENVERLDTEASRKSTYPALPCETVRTLPFAGTSKDVEDLCNGLDITESRDLDKVLATAHYEIGFREE